MLIKTSNTLLNVVELSSPAASNSTLIFLHGFTGSSKDWEIISSKFNADYKIFAVDLIGHGKSDSPKDVSLYSVTAQTKQLSEVFEKITKEKIILAGYSMGGRLALSFAASYPQKLKGLILESTTAGIPDKNMREDRIKSDEELSKFILNNSMENFVEYWINLDIFSSQKNLSEQILSKIRIDKLCNNKTGLANSLRGFGTGIMPSLHKKIKNIKIKTLLISGELDSKYTDINSEMMKIFPNASHQIIKSAGHNVHLEQPQEYYDVINNYLKRL